MIDIQNEKTSRRNVTKILSIYFQEQIYQKNHRKCEFDSKNRELLIVYRYVLKIKISFCSLKRENNTYTYDKSSKLYLVILEQYFVE